jgi:glycosyltransferase involved in cell wall biosynthesis
VLPYLAREVDVTLLTDARQPSAASDLPQVALRAPGSGRGAAWLQLAVPKFLRHSPTLFHCPFYGLPYRQPAPMVVTIHDLTFEHHPEWFSHGRRATFRLQARHAARTARRIFTDSEHIRSDVIDHYRIDEKRVVVAPLAVNERFRTAPIPTERERAAARYGVDQPYLIALGGAPRRRLSTAIEAWRSVRLAHPELHLVVVGSEQPPPEKGLVAVGAVSDQDWFALLSGATAFCYSTAYEGFGMPALEAIAAGTVVVCARVGSLPEVLGDAARWCDDSTSESLSNGLAAVIEDDECASELRGRGRQRIEHGSTWADSARITVDTYREALDG